MSVVGSALPPPEYIYIRPRAQGSQWNNSICGGGVGGGKMDCEAFLDLGPPPSSILNIPPPPFPPHMESLISRLYQQQERGINYLDNPLSNPHHNHQSNPQIGGERGGTIDNVKTVLPDAGSSGGGGIVGVVCGFCSWASGNAVGYVELAQRGPVIDDTWFLVIISSCVAATLLGIILAIAFLKYREGKLKPLSDVALAKKEKALGLERCEAVLYPHPSISVPPLPLTRLDGRTAGLVGSVGGRGGVSRAGLGLLKALESSGGDCIAGGRFIDPSGGLSGTPGGPGGLSGVPGDPSTASGGPGGHANGRSRALWAGIKPLEGNHYTINHCQPVTQKPIKLNLLSASLKASLSSQQEEDDSNYDYPDYSAYAKLNTLNKLNNTLPSQLNVHTQLSQQPTHTLTQLNTHTQHPTQLKTPQNKSSFENIGYVAAADESLTESLVADDNSTNNTTNSSFLGLGEDPNQAGCSLVSAPRAARLLGASHVHANAHTDSHTHTQSDNHYEMVTPPRFGNSSLSGSLGTHTRQTPLAHAHAPRYTLTAVANGDNTHTHTLTHTPHTHTNSPSHSPSPRMCERERRPHNTHVSLAPDTGVTHTRLTHTPTNTDTQNCLVVSSPSDHIYASPITSPVI